jgi:hypothetical protein
MEDYRFEEMKEEYLDEMLELYNYYVLNSTVIGLSKTGPWRQGLRQCGLAAYGGLCKRAGYPGADNS